MTKLEANGFRLSPFPEKAFPALAETAGLNPTTNGLLVLGATSEKEALRIVLGTIPK
jgi:hypothetical protein